jgi:hypothetical protein
MDQAGMQEVQPAGRMASAPTRAAMICLCTLLDAASDWIWLRILPVCAPHERV